MEHGIRKKTVRSLVRHLEADWKRWPGRKLRGSRSGYYANSLTNVSCNQTAIYQSINSTIESIYDWRSWARDPATRIYFSFFLSFSSPFSFYFFSFISYLLRILEVFDECLHRRSSWQEVVGARIIIRDHSTRKRLIEQTVLKFDHRWIISCIGGRYSLCELNHVDDWIDSAFSIFDILFGIFLFLDKDYYIFLNISSEVLGDVNFVSFLLNILLKLWNDS